MLVTSSWVSVYLHMLTLPGRWVCTLRIWSVVSHLVAISVHLRLIFTYITVSIVSHFLNDLIDFCVVLVGTMWGLCCTSISGGRRGFGWRRLVRILYRCRANIPCLTNLSRSAGNLTALDCCTFNLLYDGCHFVDN